MPRDRDGTFEPLMVPKQQRRLDGFDDAVISLYAQGHDHRGHPAHLAEVYGTEVSRDLISRITDAVVERDAASGRTGRWTRSTR